MLLFLYYVLNNVYDVDMSDELYLRNECNENVI